MDCQMPEVDGITAARRIRGMESGCSRVPIIAVTAGTMSGTRRACLDAGMDDFLGKPFSLGRLRQKVLHWLLPSADSEPPRAEPAQEPERAEVAPARVENELHVDLSRLQELAKEAGTPRIVEELSQIFLDDIARRIVALRIASKARDQRAYLNVIHAIKGSSGNFGAVRMARIAEASERQAKRGNLEESSACVAELERALEVVRRVIDREVFARAAPESA